MEIKSIFLGNKGLSQSEANHTANVAKEIAENISNEINYMSTHAKVLNDKFGRVPYNHVRVVPDLKEKCFKEGEIYALSAWLREGIKAKARIISGIQVASPRDLGFEMPQRPEGPTLEPIPVESQMIEELSIAERAEYLICEANAAHIGKKIHPGGVIPGWRKALINTPPVEMIQGEKEYMRVDVEPVIKQEVVDELFYALQREHREVESRLNYYKAKLHNMFNEKLMAVNSANALKSKEYRNVNRDIAQQQQVIQHQAEAKRAELLKEASDLKIVIPDSLQSTLDYVQSYSKK